MIPLVVLSIMGMIAPPVWANGCRVVKRVRVVRVPVVKRVIVNRFIPVLTPVYLSTYTPPAPAPLQAPAYTPPAAPAPAAAPPAAPAYEAPAPAAAPPAPAYTPPAAAPARAPEYGSNGNGAARASDDTTDRIITALEKLEERIEGLEARKQRVPARSQEYEEDDPPPVKRKAPRQMPQEPEDPEDDPPPVKKELPKKSTSSLRRAIQQRRAAVSRQESRAPSAPVSTLQRVHGIILQSCSGCHSAEDGARRGKGFVLVRQGRVIDLTPAIRRAIVAEVSGSTMPPRPTPPMNPADRQLLIQALRS